MATDPVTGLAPRSRRSRSASLAEAAALLDASRPAATPYVLDEALAGTSARPALRGTVDTDVCIVGGGYTGLWTALRIKELEPSARVTIVDAGICGAAASGRNSGFALSWWMKIGSLIRRVGRAEAVRLARQSVDAIDELERFCNHAAIDAHFARDGFIYAAASRAEVGAWPAPAALAELDPDCPLHPIGGHEIRERTGSGRLLAGVRESCAGTVQPAALVRGLFDVALNRGIEIYERSRVTRVDRAKGVLVLDGGEVRAQGIVLAMNTWLAHVRGVGRSILPLGTYVCVTEPAPEALRQLAWNSREGITTMATMGGTICPTHDGRIKFGYRSGSMAFRGRCDRPPTQVRPAAIAAIAGLHRLFPEARALKVTHAWGGWVDRSTDGLPFYGRLTGGCPIVYGAGLSGSGVAQCVLSGHILAASVLGIDNEWSAHPLNDSQPPGRFPPEPLRFLGGSLVRRAVGRKDGREADDLPSGAMTNWLSSFAPPGFKGAAGHNR